MERPSPELVQSRLDYDPETGTFTWLPRPGTYRTTLAWNKQWAGKSVSLTISRSSSAPGLKEYALIRLLGRAYGAHRLAWVCHHGKWPDHEIDHRDRDPLNNRISNLREATRSQNQRNKGPMRNNSSGFKGVSFRAKRAGRKKYYAQINVGHTMKFLGWFATAEEASSVFSAFAKQMHGEFYHLA
jgi:HNH endonuclease